MNPRRTRWSVALVFGALAVLAWLPRSVDGLRRWESRDGGAWYSRDPDGLYHARRVERALREGTVAETDPRLDFPHAARIPWPPYYDAALTLALAPFAPDDEAQRRAWVERATASAPRIFGVIAVLLAAFGALRLGGLAAALIAGVTIALCRGAINYSVVGTGDHHAWVSMLAALSLVLASEALRRDALQSVRRSAVLGVALGAVCGLMIGSWVAALVNVLFVQIALGWMVVRRARDERPGSAMLGLTKHLAALAVLLPAVASSPWRGEFPWMAVNLSWLHAAILGIGALVFMPLERLGRGALATGTRAARSYPWIVAGVLASAGAACWAFELAPARGLRAGFEWVSRADQFMDSVQESNPLVGARAEPGVLFLALGYGILALPLALAVAGWSWWREKRDEWLPWIVAAVVLTSMALTQRRFADALAAPMAVVLGAAAARCAPWLRSPVVASGAVLLAALAQFPSAAAAWTGLTRERDPSISGPHDVPLAERRAMAWIAEQSEGRDAWSVLAHWDLGHTIEWAARAPSVATNFGSYVGLDSYRDPARFFLSESPSAARAILQRRRTRYVYATARNVTLISSMCRLTDSELRDAFLRLADNGAPVATDRWFGTMAARLLFLGVPVAPSGASIGDEPLPPGYLRLVYVTRERDPRYPEPMTGLPLPVALVWEHVEGASIETRAAPGDELALGFDVAYPDRRYRLPWRAHVAAGVDGVARVRVPYATDGVNGTGRVENARWSCGARGGALVVPESAVQSGARIELP